MRTKEFIKRVEELGLKVIAYESNCLIVHNGVTVADVDNFIPMQISTYYYEYDKLCDGDREKFFDLLVEYAKTPIEDREEEKKFYAKHRYLVQAGDYTTAFLNYATNNDRLYVYTKAQTYSVKTQFTLKEIEEIKKKLNTDLKDFELVEVEE